MTGLRFVVHQHHATTLHWDLRLEAEDGVLKSWAVPRGPSMDPRERRLAVRTDDHALAYRGFEGMLEPDGPGGGPVIIWDEGELFNLSHVPRQKQRLVPLVDAVERGHVGFGCVGHKLVGAFALTRTSREPRESWILVKQRDDHAVESDEPDALVTARPESVRSGRTIVELRAEGRGSVDATGEDGA